MTDARADFEVASREAVTAEEASPWVRFGIEPEGAPCRWPRVASISGSDPCGQPSRGAIMVDELGHGSADGVAAVTACYQHIRGAMNRGWAIFAYAGEREC